MKNIKAQISIGLVCLILSFFIVLQLKSVKDNTVETYPNQVRLEQAQELLRLEKEKTEALYKQVMEYKDEIGEYQSRAANNDDMMDMLKNMLTPEQQSMLSLFMEGGIP